MDTKEGGGFVAKFLAGEPSPKPERKKRGPNKPGIPSLPTVGAGRPCNCCKHPQRDAIDAALVTKRSMLTELSQKFGVSIESLYRHRENHLPVIAKQTAVSELVEAESGRALDLLEEVAKLHRKAIAILAQAEEAGDLKTALSGVREAARTLELIAKLRGEIDDSVNVNILLAPQIVAVQQVILAALAPHPAARMAVVEALAQIESAAQ